MPLNSYLVPSAGDYSLFVMPLVHRQTGLLRGCASCFLVMSLPQDRHAILLLSSTSPQLEHEP